MENLNGKRNASGHNVFKRCEHPRVYIEYTPANFCLDERIVLGRNERSIIIISKLKIFKAINDIEDHYMKHCKGSKLDETVLKKLKFVCF